MLSRISVVVCTHNRAECINTALQSLQRQTLPSNFYEILLVDNASTDNTYQEVRRWAATTPNLRYVCEHRLGLSFARNTGALLSTTPYIAYMDDDAYADPQWLESIVEAFENSKKFIGVVGGRVWLDWGGAPPSWLPQQYWSLYTYLDQGNQGHFLSPGEYLVGANMAFHRATLLDQGGFATYLGRKGRNLLSGEESALLQRLRLQNISIYYEPKAIVWHKVAPSRQRPQWFLKRLFWDGASQPLIDFGTNQPRRFYAVQVHYDVRRIARFMLHRLGALLHGEIDSLEYILPLIQRFGRLYTNARLFLRG